jgi:hypothetical protein
MRSMIDLSPWAMRRTAAALSLAAAALSAAGCGNPAFEAAATGNAVADCRLWFRALRAAVDDAGVGDARAEIVAGHPYLRSDRFLASFARDDLGPAAVAAWADRLAALGADGDAVEIANLPAAARAALDAQSRTLTGRDAPAARAHCAEVLRAHDLADAAGRERLRAAVVPPDHYLDWRRVLGLYPLTAVPVAIGYAQWKRANLGVFRNDPRTLPSRGRLTAYAPAEGGGALAPARVAAMLARTDALGIPEPDDADARMLAAAFAPVWLVDKATGDDRIGAVRLGADGPVVGTEKPAVYYRYSHTRVGGRVLLQISYLAWFPARPKDGVLDLLGGALDGVIWRVTVGAGGAPLAYDTIHACGCYHLFFPVRPWQRRPGPRANDIRERAEVPASGPVPAPGERVMLRIASASHYLQGVYADPPPANALRYRLLPADGLRSRPVPGGGRRSLFGPDGLVAGSERLERVLLWPMGIESAGAMRQWGTRATAFVGRRHFDDPRLLDDAFQWPRPAR